MRAVFSWLGLALFATACGGDSDALTLTSGTSPLPRLGVRALAASDPGLARALGRSRLVSSASGAESRAAHLDDTVVRVPSHADGFIEIASGPRTRPLARLRLRGVNDAPLELDAGTAVYRHALGDAHVIWTTRDDAIEELVHVEKRVPELRFEWELEFRHDLAVARAEPEQALVLRDATGQARLRVPDAFALDARGQKRALRASYSATNENSGTLAFELDARDLAFPLLVDPALEVVTWDKKAFAGVSPPNRWDHGMAYDPARGVSVVFGGRDTDDASPYFGDTWEWDGTSWKPITPKTQSPKARQAFGMAYSSVHGGVVLFGGLVKDASNQAVTIGDTWKWDGQDWTLLPAGASDPPNLFALSLAFDSKRGVVVLYGGLNETTDNVEVYELGASGWTKPPNQQTSPSFLSYFPMTYHAKSGVTLISDGLINGVFGVFSDKTWTYDGQTWTDLGVTGPSARQYAAGAYDEKRARSVFFGGDTQSGDVDETWEFSEGAWEERLPINRPQAMSSMRMAYDSKRDRIVMFGGWTLVAEGTTWEYVHFGNTCSVTADCDGYSCLDGVCCSVNACNTCQACSATTGKCETVVSADDADSCSGQNTCDASGACKKKDGQACTQPGDCASGNCADGVCCDKPCTGNCEACGLTGSVGKCSLVTGPPVHGSCPGSGPCGASCSGASADCSFAATGSDCGSTCSDAEITKKTCDGAGVCGVQAPAACDNHYACASPSACHTSCQSGSECAPGFVCLDHACKEGVQACVDDVTAQDPSGKQTACTPYRCANGTCRTNCASAADCAPGNLCTQNGFCAPRPSSPSADSGCGCHLPASPRTPSNALLALGLLAFLARRRRA